MQSALQRHIVDDDAVNAHTDLCLALKRLDVDIRGGGRHGTLHKAVQQAMIGASRSPPSAVMSMARSSVCAAAISLLLALRAALRALTSA